MLCNPQMLLSLVWLKPLSQTQDAAAAISVTIVVGCAMAVPASHICLRLMAQVGVCHEPEHVICQANSIQL